MSTCTLLRRAASSAASLTMLASSAPARPDLLAAFQVRHVDHDLAVEPAGTQQGGIENVGTVGGGEQNDAVVRLEAIHFDEQLIQRLLALVVAATEPSPAVPADGIDLVDEDDARGMRLALLEQVAHARGTDADEHLDEVGARHREERPARFTGDGLGEQRLARSRRPHQECAFRQATTQPLEFLRVLQEIDDLLELLLRLIAAGDVGERNLGRVARQQLCLGFAEGEGAVPALLHLPQHEDHEAEDQDVRQEREQHDAERLPRLPRADVHALHREIRGELVVRLEREQHVEALHRLALHHHRTLERAADLLPLGDFHRGDVAGVELFGELRVRNFGFFAAAARSELHQRDRPDDEERPERERPQHPGPVEFPRGRWYTIGHLRQTRDIRKVPEVFRVIEAVPDQEQRRGVESQELRFQLQVFRHMFVQQRTDLQTTRPALSQQRDQLVQRLASVDDILDQQDVLPRELGFGVIHQPHIPARHRSLAIARCDEEIHLQRPVDAPHQIAQEDEASLEEAEHQQIAIRIGRGDFAPQGLDSLGDRLLIEDDALELTPAGLLELSRAG
ncbi:MAG: hypothetical protein AUH41_10030 [Gemmatimonadetes bacterium 13_1_40CM_66_11]|nr:MAG: hypothetical protein AUH41_10030 [Gemmatimonadetes bacterium 13_1_40CM_66_11]